MPSKKITKLQNNLEKARHALEAAVSAEQQACQHAEIAEANGSPPVRICCECGMREVGWGPGFVALLLRKGHLLRVATNDYMLKEARGLFVLDHHKGPLLRKEVTLQQLAMLDAARK